VRVSSGIPKDSCQAEMDQYLPAMIPDGIRAFPNEAAMESRRLTRVYKLIQSAWSFSIGFVGGAILTGLWVGALLLMI
jgi:hypothetical protein